MERSEYIKSISSFSKNGVASVFIQVSKWVMEEGTVVVTNLGVEVWWWIGIEVRMAEIQAPSISHIYSDLQIFFC